MTNIYNSNKIIVVDSIMGSGKTSWVIDMLNTELDRNFLYITPLLDETRRIKERVTARDIYCPENHGSGKIGNIANLLSNQMDIASTHELFRRFDDKCKSALNENKYTLILDETLTAVEPYHFTGKEDYQYLLQNQDIKVNSDGLIEWIGSELDTRFDDVRLLATNKCLFVVDGKFFLWHFPHDIFTLFEKVYVLTYLFPGSLMKYYFDIYHLEYEVKSVKCIDGTYRLTDYYVPDKSKFRERLSVYEGKLNTNISQKHNMLSATWSKSAYNKEERCKIKNNFYNFRRNIMKASGEKTMWTCYKDCRKELTGKGYANSFVPCNCRATNEYQEKTCLMYGVNWFEHPEVLKFFTQHGITVDQEMTALSTILQWIWRSNIRVPDSTEKVTIYIPAKRMRNLFTKWLNG